MIRLLGTLAVLLPLLSACGGDAGKYAGTWKRDLYGEGEVHMKLASNGGVELMLPSPRWPDSVDMKGRAQVKGDTLVFKADTAERLSDYRGALCGQSHRGPAAYRGARRGQLRRPPGGAGRDLAEELKAGKRGSGEAGK